MKKLLFVVTTAIIFFVSCTKNEEQDPTTVKATGDFVASFAEPYTSLDAKVAVWGENDCLTVFTKTSHNRKYQVEKMSDGGSSATFGYVSYTDSEATSIASNYALYPYDADATLSGDVITTTLAAKQTYNAEKPLDYALMAAMSKNSDLSFVNAGALMQFNVSKSIPDACTLKAIKVTSSAKKIAGKVTINCGRDTYTAVVSADGVKQITLTDINAEITAETQSFYIAMPSVGFVEKDLTVTFVFAEGENTIAMPAFYLKQGTIKSVNYEIDNVQDITGKRSLSILFVGNSLTQDGIAYLPFMLKNYYPEVDFKIYMWYMGGYNLEQQYSNFTSSGVADIFSVAENSESWTNYNKSKTMASVLSDYKFDIVCVQEYFNYKTSYTNCNDWNKCRDFILKNYKGGNDLKFISLLHAPLRKSGYNVHEVYERTKEGNALILQTTVSEDLIPFGIAVYKALETDLNTLGDLGQLTPDGTHTQEGLPCLLQTYVALEWIFDRFDMAKTVLGHPMRMNTGFYNSIRVPGANLGSGVVQGSDAQYKLAQEIAIEAYKEGKEFLKENLSQKK